MAGAARRRPDATRQLNYRRRETGTAAGVWEGGEERGGGGGQEERDGQRGGGGGGSITMAHSCVMSI